MPDSKISGLTAAASMTDATELVVNQAATSLKVTGSQVKAWIGNSLRNVSVASQTPAAGVLTYLTNSNISIPAGLLRVATVFKWRLAMAKTAAGIATRAFHVRLGTTGTTADAAILTFTSTVGTAAVDQGMQDFVVTIRGPLGAACIAQGHSFLAHDQSITGFLNVETQLLLATSAGFNSTTPNLIIGLSVTSAASEAITFSQVIAEAGNL